MPLTNKQILAIDDSASIRTFLRISLQAQGATVHEAPSATQGIEMSEIIHPDLIVLDLGLPDRDGLELVPILKEHTKNGVEPVIIILSVRKDQQTMDKALALGASAYITKPFLVEELVEVLENKLHVKMH